MTHVSPPAKHTTTGKGAASSGKAQHEWGGCAGSQRSSHAVGQDALLKTLPRVAGSCCVMRQCFQTEPCPGRAQKTLPGSMGCPGTAAQGWRFGKNQSLHQTLANQPGCCMCTDLTLLEFLFFNDSISPLFHLQPPWPPFSFPQPSQHQ